MTFVNCQQAMFLKICQYFGRFFMSIFMPCDKIRVNFFDGS
ncbi:hypothetical protein EJK55_1729 [Moraxella catarrhalis]|uniref:Uncharacterized protein n=1 Tax=Moraxella catarrhalis TaxID=480 RepID=A0ABY0BKD6_MORCA|nr:hypothetical protein EJK52_1910 [Moraxella catarrhalis]AZQ90536.1 hypothetical protein EJK51_1912 [Moraxella catarrhalis]RUO16508.1 hypothetical protein EJK54_1761 [Moraxella catarrhalis]RUO16839.1 hypothetical protein EJK55_1729 [Moraxella catarrhalis]